MWFALDYSEDEANGLPQKLAVKLAETKKAHLEGCIC